MSHRRAVPFLLVVAALAAACGGKPAPEAPAPEAPDVPPPPPSVSILTPTSTPLVPDGQDAAAARRAVLAQSIYFGYDRADLTPEAKRVLDAKAAALREDPSLRVTIVFIF